MYEFYITPKNLKSHLTRYGNVSICTPFGRVNITKKEALRIAQDLDAISFGCNTGDDELILASPIYEP